MPIIPCARARRRCLPARRKACPVSWADTEGESVCPRCGCCTSYTLAKRKLWDCKACRHQYSVTSGTIFASRELPIAMVLLSIAIFVNGAKGHSALQLSRD